MNEQERIQRIKQILGSQKNTIVGIGDDTAIITMGSEHILFCSDAFIEDIHFRREWSSPRDIGFKSVASCLSDIAAMNGRPVAITISIALPTSLDSSWLEEYYQGVKELQSTIPFSVAGGDLSRSTEKIFIDVAAVGQSSRPCLRSSAQVGDLLVVSGPLGQSRAGLEALKKHETASEYGPLIAAHLYPHPRWDWIDFFANHGAPNALIDISDGLASEATHISKSSNVSVHIEYEKIPITILTQKAAEHFGKNIESWSLAGGEDYQLLMTVSPSTWAQWQTHLPNGATVIGNIKNGTGLTITHQGESMNIPLGFDHFS